MTFEFELIAAVLFGIVDIYCIYRLLNHKLTFRFSREKLVPVYAGVYILYILMQILMGIFSSYPVKLPLLLLFYSSFFIIYSDAFHIKLFWLFCAILALSLCELVSSPIVMLITHTPLGDISQTKSAFCVGMALSRIMLFFLIVYLTHSANSEKKIFQGFSKEIFAIIFIDGIYMTLTLNFFYYNTIY